MLEYHNRRPANPLQNESGFTLLEIIAVLVILSILAVVAVPKYFDLQTEARNKAIKTALAEGIGRVNGYFAQQVLAGNTPGQIDYSVSNLGEDMGDFTLSVSGDGATPSGAASGGTNFTITVTGKTGTPLENVSTSRVITRPGSI